jgi:hypothetical protein
MNTRATGWAALLAALALAIGGCGSDNGSTPQAAPTSASAPAPTPTPTAVYYGSCGDAERAGKPTIRKGEPGYRTGLDLDGDGIACAAATAQPKPTITGEAAARAACHRVSELDIGDEVDPAVSGPVADLAAAAPGRDMRAAADAIRDALLEQASDGYAPGTGPPSLLGAWTDLAEACSNRYGDGPW